MIIFVLGWLRKRTWHISQRKKLHQSSNSPSNMGLLSTRNLILLAFLAVTLLPKIQAGELLMSDIPRLISLWEFRFIKRRMMSDERIMQFHLNECLWRTLSYFDSLDDELSVLWWLFSWAKYAYNKHKSITHRTSKFKSHKTWEKDFFRFFFISSLKFFSPSFSWVEKNHYRNKIVIYNLSSR